MNFYGFTLLLEGQAEDFVAQNPELKQAYDQGIRNANHLRWLARAKEHEPLRDAQPTNFPPNTPT